jgi:hypothetical protein
MACEKTKLVTYDVYEYDAAGVAHKSDKRIELDISYGQSESLVLAFFKQMFDTINTPSGFSATFDGTPSQYDLITIRWRSPHWKLVRV